MKKVLRWGLWIMLGLVVILVIAHLVENWRGQKAWATWKTAQEAKGSHYDWSRFVPPEVPDSENFAKIPIVEAAVTGKSPVLKGLKFPEPYPVNGTWRLGQRENLEAWRLGYQTNNLETTLSQWGPELTEFEAATRRPKCRLPGKYTFPEFGDSRVHILGFRAVVRVLRLRALACLETGQTGPALVDVITMLRVSRHLKDEPSLIVQLLEIANTNLAMQPIWEGVSTRRWNLAQLTTLQIELEQLDLIRSFHRCIDCERLRGVQIGRAHV